MTTSPDALIRTVAAHRDQTADARPFPNAADCALFAITEAGELIDAWLRQEPKYLRNHARQPSPSDEAGDLGYMIASAIVAIQRQNAGRGERRSELAAAVLDRVAWAIISMRRGYQESARSNLGEALDEWIAMVEAQGWNARELIAATAERIDARWKPAP